MEKSFMELNKNKHGKTNRVFFLKEKYNSPQGESHYAS